MGVVVCCITLTAPIAMPAGMTLSLEPDRSGFRQCYAALAFYIFSSTGRVRVSGYSFPPKFSHP